MDLDDDHIPDDDPQPGLDLVPTLTLPRRSAIDWDRTRLTPGLVRALAKAQAEARTVGKSSTIEARGDVKARKYAGADAMIEEATAALSSNGIAWVCASTSRQATDKRHADECGDKQWVCSVVETTSLIMHAPEVNTDGHTADEVGLLVTYGETASIGRNGTPIDKADKAAETYLRLYLARDLVGLDRGDEAGAEDDPNRRDDAESAAGRGTAPAKRDSSRRETVIRDAIAMRCKSINAVRKAMGSKYVSAQQLIDDAVGEPFMVNTPDDAQRALDALDRYLLKINADARQE